MQADEKIRNYAEAIDNFLSGFNQCRGIIASRQFRGPKHLVWPRFRILPLESRRSELIRKAELPPMIEKELIKQVQIASQEIQEMTKNPMFLGILCEDMRSGNPFPENAHSVFERYLDKRLTRDQERLERRFNLQPSEIRTIAERVAFCMSIDRGLGLSPTREAIRSAMTRLNLRVPGNFDQFLTALEYLKLARSETESIPGESQSFTFAHRRFQEYFATCVVLRELDRISPRELLTNGRWRETAVVIFQTQPSQVFSPILAEARQLLEEMLSSLSGLIDDPIGYVDEHTVNKNRSSLRSFSWPTGVLHLLSLLQDGFISRIKDLPDDIQMQVGRLVLSASITGTLADQKWSLEVAGITPQPVLLWLLRNAFASQSQWLKEVAYRQTARLNKIPDDIAASIRQSLLGLFASGRLHRERFATEAHLSRLDQSAKFLSVMRLLRWIGPIDNILHLGGFFVLFLLFTLAQFNLLYQIFVAIFLGSILLFSRFTLQNITSIINNLSFSLRSFWNQISLGRASTPTPTSGPSSLVVFSRFLSLYCRLLFLPLLWSVFAIIAANIGEFTHPVWWLFLFIFPLLYCISNFKRLIKICMYLLSNFSIWIILVCYIILIISTYRGIQGESLLYEVMFYVYIIIFLCYLLGISVIGIIALFRLLKDWIKWQNWLKNRPSSMTSKELLNLIKLYHYSGFCKRLITVIREQNILMATEEDDELISKLALAVERALVVKKRKLGNRQKKWQKIRTNPIFAIKYIKLSLERAKKRRNKQQKPIYLGSDFFYTWLEDYTKKDVNRLTKLGHECLDEIYILLEQVRAKRQSS